MAAHTPGPWSVQQFNVTLPSARYKPVWLLNAAGERMYCIGATDAVLPDARLIAAAPDMLDALKQLVAQIEDYERVNNLAPNPGKRDCWQAVTQARAAIAKADPTPLPQ